MPTQSMSDYLANSRETTQSHFQELHYYLTLKENLASTNKLQEYHRENAKKFEKLQMIIQKKACTKLQKLLTSKQILKT